MTMTADEIIMEYKQAKDPEKQIRIMADQCLCKPSEIRSILRDAGVYQAKVRKPRNQTQPSAPEKAAAQPATPKAPKTPEAQPSAPAETTTQPRDQAEPGTVIFDAAPAFLRTLDDVVLNGEKTEPEKGFSFTVKASDLPPGDFEKLKEWAKEPRHDLPARNVEPEPLYDIKDIKASALDAIAESSKKLDGGPIEDFVERVRGILMLVEKLEEQGGRND